MNWLKGHWQLVLLTALVFVLWTTPVVTPLKILVVFLHEVSHGLAALVTGGQVESISLSLDQGGLTMTRGGNLFAILSAGYVGSLFLGVFLLLAATHTRFDRALMALLGLAVLLIAALYMRTAFALAFTTATGAGMLAMARFLPHQASDLGLRLIGLVSMIYVPFDIFSDTIARAHLRSDAYMLAEEFGGATMLWGIVWLVLSLVVIFLSLRHGLGARSNIRFEKTGAG